MERRQVLDHERSTDPQLVGHNQSRTAVYFYSVLVLELYLE
jgi:hypothetical protein